MHATQAYSFGKNQWSDCTDSLIHIPIEYCSAHILCRSPVTKIVTRNKYDKLYLAMTLVDARIMVSAALVFLAPARHALKISLLLFPPKSQSSNYPIYIPYCKSQHSNVGLIYNRFPIIFLSNLCNVGSLKINKEALPA